MPHEAECPLTTFTLFISLLFATTNLSATPKSSSGLRPATSVTEASSFPASSDNRQRPYAVLPAATRGLHLHNLGDLPSDRPPIAPRYITKYGATRAALEGAQLAELLGPGHQVLSSQTNKLDPVKLGGTASERDPLRVKYEVK
ncbi:unnamed protein product [Protopolystoma xenopodis]|uniref:Uncharacterized protein n=1 Tax=Protopolystoma xenopodis TaxID=117903 RepID=A0A448WBT6_9PLAT|nr:unnamed protein product [Protopolystoma xenopodis]